MPVYKYKTFEEAENALKFHNVDSVDLNRLKEFYELQRYFPNHKIQRGILKFKTFEEMNEYDLNQGVKNSQKLKEKST
ncbi:MAG: hypothetical protein RDU14_07105 [Melioribacteraceae bacterium]|nr:hypothetical protein [Melioribacteraceae bacterium]